MITFINTQNWLVIFLMAPALHGLFYIICLKEPRALEMFMVKMNKGFKCINKGFHGYTNSYDPN